MNLPLPESCHWCGQPELLYRGNDRVALCRWCRSPRTDEPGCPVRNVMAVADDVSRGRKAHNGGLAIDVMNLPRRVPKFHFPPLPPEP